MFQSSRINCNFSPNYWFLSFILIRYSILLLNKSLSILAKAFPSHLSKSLSHVSVSAKTSSLFTYITVFLFFSLKFPCRPHNTPNMLSYHNTNLVVLDEVLTFLGNSTHSDHFKLLQQDGSSLLIGARNVVYNISLSDLTENTDLRITWNSRTRDRELCLVKGKSVDDCNNYVRVLAKVSSDTLLVCGTNSYNPRCRNYARNNESVYEVVKEFSGKGYCPYDPAHNSTSIFTGKACAKIFFLPSVFP